MPYFVYYTISDGDNDTSTIEIPIPNGITETNLGAFVTAGAQVIAPLITGGIQSAGVRLEFDVSGVLGPVGQLLSDVQEKAFFSFRTAGGFLKSLSLPTFDETKFTLGGSGKEVDVTDADVQAFITFMEDGTTVNAELVGPVDQRGEDLVSLVEAGQQFGNKRYS